MQMIIPNTANAWLLVACAVFMIVLCFGQSFLLLLKKANRRFHIIGWDMNSPESIYDMDDEHDMI